MAESKPLGSKQVSEKDVFKDITKSAEIALVSLKDLDKGFEEVIKSQTKILSTPSNVAKDAESYKKLNKVVNENKAAVKGLTDVRTQILKTEAKLKQARSTEIDQLTESKLALQQQNKINKDFIASKSSLLDQYERESAQLRVLRKQYKGVAAEQGKGSVAAIELLEEVTQLDTKLKEIDESAGQFQRNVGNYPKAIQPLVINLIKLEAQLEDTEKQFGKNSKEARKLRKETKRLGSEIEQADKKADDSERSFKDLTKTFVKAALAAAAAKLSFNTLKDSLQANEEGSEDLREVSAQLGSAYQTLTNRVGSFASGLFQATKQVVTGNGSYLTLLSSLGKIRNSFSGVTEEIFKNADAAKQAEQNQIDFEKSSRDLRLELAKITGELEEQQALSGEDIRGFDAQIQAGIRASELLIVQTSIRKQLIEEEIDIINKQIKARGEGANNLALSNELAAKQIELQEVANDLSVAQIDNEVKLRVAKRDRFERELDFAVDAFDAQKTVNEKLAANDRVTLESRRKIFDETVKLANSAFQEQIKLVEGFTGEQIGLQELVLEQDERVIRERLRAFQFDDITQGRILEIIRERKFVTQDLADITKDLADAQRDLNTELRETSTAINIEEISFEIDKLRESLGNLGEDDLRNQTKIQRQIITLKTQAINEQAELDAENARKTIVNQELLNETLLKIENKKNNDIARLNVELNNTLEDIRNKRLDDIIDFTKKVEDELTNLVKQRSEERIEQIEKEIGLREEAIETQRQLAAQGLDNELDTQQARLETKKLALKEEEELARKKEEAIKIAEVFIESYLSRLKAGESPTESSTGAFKDALLAKGIAKGFQSLTGFFDGTDYVSTSTHPEVGKGRDSFLARVNKGERIVPTYLNKHLGNISNKDLVDKVSNNYTTTTTAMNQDQVNQIVGAIKSQPNGGVKYDVVKGIVEEVIKGGRKQIIKNRGSNL